MTDFNRDLDKYIQRRNDPDTFSVSFTGGDWLNKLIQSSDDDFDSQEERELRAMEGEIATGAAQLEAVHEYEHDLEDEQERKVGLYHQIMGLFKRTHTEPQGDDVEIADMPDMSEFDMQSSNHTDDFRTLAQIQLRWLDRLPRRAKNEFLDSEDYAEMTEILQRQGVARRK